MLVGCSHYVTRQRHIATARERYAIRVQAVCQHISRRNILSSSVVVCGCREVSGIALTRALYEGRDGVCSKHALGVTDHTALVGARVSTANAAAVKAVDKRRQDAERDKNTIQGQVF